MPLEFWADWGSVNRLPGLRTQHVAYHLDLCVSKIPKEVWRSIVGFICMGGVGVPSVGPVPVWCTLTEVEVARGENTSF